MPLINIPLVVEFFKHFSDLFHVVFIRRADKFIVGRVHKVPNPFDFPCNVVYVLLRSNPCRLCFFLNFLTVLVRARLIEHVIAFLALKARNRVRQNRLVSVADMRLSRGIDNLCSFYS